MSYTSSDSNKVHRIDVSLQITPSADNPSGRTFDLDALTEAIREALDGTEVYVVLDGADGDAEDYVSFTIDVYEVTDDLAADTLPEALIGTAPAA